MNISPEATKLRMTGHWRRADADTIVFFKLFVKMLKSKTCNFHYSSVQFSFIYTAFLTVKSLNASKNAGAQTLRTSSSGKRCLLTGRNLKQDQDNMERPSW